MLSLSSVMAAGTSDEYRARRQALRESLKDGVVVLFGATEEDHGNLRTGFFQEENFYYLTGWREPGAILMILPPGTAAENRLADPEEILFLPGRNAEKEKWTGPKAAPGDSGVAEATGFRTVLPVERFEAQVQAAMECRQTFYTLPERPMADRLQKLLPMRDVSDAGKALAKLRMKKSEAEIERLKVSIDATIAAHRAAWAMVKPGLFEYEVAARMTSEYFRRGCERHAYAPIVGSGPNSTVLHYAANRRRMDAGEVLLMDVGGECEAYAADITRTVPVDGKFTARQRELYEIVLGAQKAAIAAVKPGVTLGRTTPNSLYQVAFEYLNTHGKDRNGKPLGPYFPHGIGHHVGLGVHDLSDTNAPLEPGMVITIEPGLYLPDEGIGIRIEDMVLVTEDGGVVLTAALPKEAADVENAVTR